MPLTQPKVSEVAEAAREIGLELSSEDLAFYHASVAGFVGALGAIEALPDALPEVRWPRGEWRRPTAAENPLGAWVARIEVSGAEEGPLAGRSVALKDNVALAGAPMAGGTDFLADYVPPVDATVATRILDAGGTIVGKAQCEYLSASAGSHTAATGFVHNPHRRGYSAGGSSSGSAALVAAGDVDLAIGGDQGGSIRFPSSFCGTVGMKPTFGLVPYTGILSIEATIDHAGPITANVADNALLLEVIAGPDGIDPRQLGCRTARYVEAVGQDIAGLRIGVLEEGFAADGEAGPSVRAAAERLHALGAKVEPVSVPEHSTHGVAMVAMFVIGSPDTVFADGVPSQTAGLGLPGLAAAFAGWRDHPGRIPPMAMTWILAHLAVEPQGHRDIYGKAQNLRRALRLAYDTALENFDAILMPTTDGPAPKLPEVDAALADVFAASGTGGGNAGIFDLTGHPALSVPCGNVGGLPVGAMLVGRHWEEATLYRVGHALEHGFDWRKA